MFNNPAGNSVIPYKNFLQKNKVLTLESIWRFSNFLQKILPDNVLQEILAINSSITHFPAGYSWNSFLKIWKKYNSSGDLPAKWPSLPGCKIPFCNFATSFLGLCALPDFIRKANMEVIEMFTTNSEPVIKKESETVFRHFGI